MSDFTAADTQQMFQRGISLDDVQLQLKRFKAGFPELKLEHAPGPVDGILQVDAAMAQGFIASFDDLAPSQDVCKFVPASGAASRMFRLFFAYLKQPDSLSDSEKEKVQQICQSLPRFALFPVLKAKLADVEALLAKAEYDKVVEVLLSEFANLPKALIPFHRYEGFSRTALEEHLVEGAYYCRDKSRLVRLHFTVAEQHQALFEQTLQALLPAYEKRYQCRFLVETSIQNPATDTLAVDMDNQPFRQENGTLLFRPGGHGALLENLNKLDADIVFIKNVDNVLPEYNQQETWHWKKILGGLLLETQQQLFDWQNALDQQEDIPEALIDFLEKKAGLRLSEAFSSWEIAEQKAYIHRKLHRPLRVCGVIRTEEQTGGGPFWAAENDGSQSLQLVETAQINLENSSQKAVASQSTYANITDLVCGLKDYQGKPFDLLQHRDDDAGFITEKSLNGRPLKAMELPGLWNGAMADWNTVIVEVPGSTFNPVKRLEDLEER
ncbi:MAG: DUF4301 family protein [Bacteroidia bacterium]